MQSKNGGITAQDLIRQHVSNVEIHETVDRKQRTRKYFVFQTQVGTGNSKTLLMKKMQKQQSVQSAPGRIQEQEQPLQNQQEQHWKS